MTDEQIIKKYSHLTPFKDWEEACRHLPAIGSGDYLRTLSNEEQLNYDRYVLTGAIERQKLPPL